MKLAILCLGVASAFNFGSLPSLPKPSTAKKSGGPTGPTTGAATPDKFKPAFGASRVAR